MMRTADKALILKRRAAFVGSALAVLGCSGGTRPPESSKPRPTETLVAVPEPGDAEAPNEAVPEPAERPKPARSTPPLDVPEGVSEVARERFERFAKTMNEIYDFFDQISVPERCEISKSQCESEWRKLAMNLLELGEKTRWMTSPCKGSSDAAKLYEQREQQHGEYVAKLRRELDQRIEAALAAGGLPAEQRWHEIQHDARRGRPMVCLSYACVDW